MVTIRTHDLAVAKHRTMAIIVSEFIILHGK